MIISLIWTQDLLCIPFFFLSTEKSTENISQKSALTLRIILDNLFSNCL